MKKWRWYCRLLLLLQIIVVCHCSHVTNTFQYEATNLVADVVSVHVTSDVTGSISWTFTDDKIFTISVQVTSESTSHANNTEISFGSESNAINLFIQEMPIPTAHASSVTGSGSHLHVPTLLAWLPAAVVLGWKPIYYAAWFLLCSQSIISHAQEFQTQPIDKSVHIEIRAPRHFQYSDVELYINNGTITMEEWAQSDITPPTCGTGHTAMGCPGCCHGHGSCVKDECVCNEGYDQSSFCERRTRRDIFYSHPLDPRLETSILPSEQTLTVSRSYNSPEPEMRPPFDQYPDTHVMDVREKGSNIITHRIRFATDGFIDQLEALVAQESHKIQLNRNRVSMCKINANVFSFDSQKPAGSQKGNSYDINVCDNKKSKKVRSDTMKVTKDTGNASASAVRRRKKALKKKNRKARNKSSKGSYESKLSLIKTIDVPVYTERCGYTPDPPPRVYVIATPLHNISSYRSNIGPSPTGLSLHGSETGPSDYSVMLLGHRDTHGREVVSFPDIKHSLGSEAIDAKCRETVVAHNAICSRRHLEAYPKLCAGLSDELLIDNMEYLATNSSNSTGFNKYSSLCVFVSRLLDDFCNIGAREELSRETTCHSQYSASVNLFSLDYFIITPFAEYSDGKTVQGIVQRILLRDAADVLRHGIEIADDTPDFRITKISVIPTDPVPHDIYQVKLDYDCATNNTVIKMTVTGSDKYSNHVTCHGVASFGYCTLHAAGAPNAVVDDVLIKVTDSHTGFNLTKEMVVIF